MNEDITILLVEDNADDIRLIKRALRSSIYAKATLLTAKSVADASRFTDERILLLLVDLGLPDSSGLNTVEQIRDCFPNSALIVLAGVADDEIAVAALRRGAEHYLSKDEINSRVLSRTIRFSLERHHIIQRLTATEKKLLESRLFLEESEKRLVEAQAVAKIGSWEVDLLTSNLVWSQETYRIFDLDNQTFNTTYDSFLEHVHCEDRSMVDTEFIDSFKHDELNIIEHRIITTKGILKWVEERWKVFHDKHGKTLRAVGTCQDITLRKRSEEQIMGERILSDSLINSLPGIFYLCDHDGKFTRWNKNFESISGYSYDEISLMHPLDFFDSDEKSLARTMLDTLFATGNTELTASLFTKDKKKIPHYFNGHRIQLHGTDYLIAVAFDITERMQAEEKLRSRTEEIRKLSLVASTTDSLVIITDAEEKIEWVNESFTRLTGYSLEESVGKKPKELMQGPDTDRNTLDRIKKNLKLRIPVSEEVVNYSKSGKRFWLKIDINPVFNDKGVLEKFIAVESDITRHKEYEDKIIAIARELADLIENSNAIIFGVDRNGYVNEWNKQAIAATGYGKNDILGRKLASVVAGSKSKDAVNERLLYVLEGNYLMNEAFRIIRKDGEKMILLLSANPRRNAAGEITGLLAVGQDISELTEYRQRLEEKVKVRTEELKVALEREKELSNVKTRFASMVSHEFRTPLATIRLSANYIKRYKTKLTREMIDNKVNVVLDQVDHMTHLLEAILTLGKTEDVRIKMKTSTVDLDSFFIKLKEQIENVFDNTHNISVSTSFSDVVIETDEDLLRNIFVNLLSNAIKFSPGKNVVFLHASEENGWITFLVRDQGIGIPAHDYDKIFDAFDRGSNVSSIPGTGLGLSIVRKAVELLGGTIHLESTLGEGSVFIVKIPRSES